MYKPFEKSISFYRLSAPVRQLDVERAAGVVTIGVLAVAKICACVGVPHVVGVLVWDGFLGRGIVFY